MDNLRYPIGTYHPPEVIEKDQIQNWINEISGLPQLVDKVVSELTDEQLELTYRPEGWTIRQLVYHLGDSHLNSYVRFKWTLTENTPTIKAYNEASWAAMNDSSGPIIDAIDFLKTLHSRWTHLLLGLSDEQWNLEFKHPETGSSISLKKNLGLYAWHGNHHLAHIHLALEKSAIS